LGRCSSLQGYINQRKKNALPLAYLHTFAPLFLLSFFFFSFGAVSARRVCGVWRSFISFLGFFFKFLVFFMASSSASSLPFAVSQILGSSAVVGFSGSRRFVPSSLVWGSVVACVPISSVVVVGCASGLDSLARGSFAAPLVFAASSFGFGRGSFAARSVAFVRYLLGCPSSVLVSFPASVCPVGLVPSSKPSKCFAGFGSGSWASLALAVGSRVPCLVWLPLGVCPPVLWGLVPVGSGWWSANISSH
jgi:hypothetical protein